MGNGVAFTQTLKIIVPLFERMRNQYCVLRLRPVTVSVWTPCPTVTLVSPRVKVELVARSIVNPVSLLELSTQFRITERVLLEFAPFTSHAENSAQLYRREKGGSSQDGQVQVFSLWLDL